MSRRFTIITLITALLLGLTMCKEDAGDCPPDGGVNPNCESSMPIGEEYVIEVPFYVSDPLLIPEDNPMRTAAVELGRFLFWEKKLSGNNAMSCGTCHAPDAAFSDPQATSTGIDGVNGTRNSMALVNLVFDEIITWDGAQPDLEQQSIEPVENVIEMHDEWVEVVLELAGDPLYPPMFESAYGTDCVTKERASKAIAQFIRSMTSFNAKYDRASFGPENFTELENIGLTIWNQEGGDPEFTPGGQFGADCFHCHTLSNHRFTDNEFHNNGLDSVFTDLGRGGVTGLPQDMGLFKTPTLRNIELSAPYMHDGRFNTLAEVIDHYNSGGHPSPTIDPFMKFSTGGLALTPEKKEGLIAFLKTFTDEEFVNNPAFQDPH